MRRREFLVGTAALGVTLAASRRAMTGQTKPAAGGGGKLTAPAKGTIPVAVAISEGATVIDFAGPWEVFQDVHVPERGSDMDEIMPFRLFTVSETTKPLRGSAGLQLVADYTFENAPQPRVIVVGAQRGSDALHAWLRKASEKADLTMSVCTGAFQLARAGLLSGKPATTHHDSLERSVRFNRAADGLDRIGDLERRTGLGALIQKPARHEGEARLGLGIVARAREHTGI